MSKDYTRFAPFMFTSVINSSDHLFYFNLNLKLKGGDYDKNSRERGMTSVIHIFVTAFIVHRALYLTRIEGYMERDIFYTAPPYHG